MKNMEVFLFLLFLIVVILPFSSGAMCCPDNKVADCHSDAKVFPKLCKDSYKCLGELTDKKCYLCFWANVI